MPQICAVQLTCAWMYLASSTKRKPIMQLKRAVTGRQPTWLHVAVEVP